jgi:hypothetical protein
MAGIGRAESTFRMGLADLRRLMEELGYEAHQMGQAKLIAQNAVAFQLRSRHNLRLATGI